MIGVMLLVAVIAATGCGQIRQYAVGPEKNKLLEAGQWNEAD